MVCLSCRGAKQSSMRRALSPVQANISHEIRTPLNGMLAVAQLLLSTSLTPEQRQACPLAVSPTQHSAAEQLSGCGGLADQLCHLHAPHQAQTRITVFSCRELADMLMDSGHTLLTILGDILDFSKIDAHAMTLQTQLVDLRSPMEASLQMVRDTGDHGELLCSALQVAGISTWYALAHARAKAWDCTGSSRLRGSL